MSAPRPQPHTSHRHGPQPREPQSPPPCAPARVRVRVAGAVQGVGFRPFVWTLARELDLSGWVLNDGAGVLLEAEGGRTDHFLERLKRDAPPLARIDRIESDRLPVQGNPDAVFEIRPTPQGETARTMVTPDMATCPACLEDIVREGDRRAGYAFTNCTHCGPRYTITRALPYDRAQTSMAPFALCPDCAREYADPADRRFHAQPNACPACGPRYSEGVAAILDRIRRGEILALKGIGGFHLVVDARNGDAVERLRARKDRDGKPFAVMVADLAAARRLAMIDPEAELALTGPARPVVIVPSRSGQDLAPGVGQGLATLGLMLAYAPIHTLLFHEASLGGEDLALVMTSANPSGDPLVTDNDDAHRRLAAIADHVVTHDRDILVRCDDSVVRVIAGAPRVMRRARGFVPEPIHLPQEGPCVLAMGGHLKTTICVTRGDEAFLSQHIGDLDGPETLAFHRETVCHLLSILDVTPERVACDLHPDFLSTHEAEAFGVPVVRVQHHQAHLAGLAAEHGIAEPMLGLALDGFGLGADGRASWGGERMIVGGASVRHMGSFAPLAQPGGDRAAREPWRMGAAALHALGRGAEIPRRFAAFQGADLLAAMVARGVNAPATSSAGRLFDAACGLLGVKPVATFEGEAPMALEALAGGRTAVLADGWSIDGTGTLAFAGLLEALADSGAHEGAALFHGTLAAALCDWVVTAFAPGAPAHGLARRVGLSGGCVQNKLLVETLIAHLGAHGVEAVLPLKAPANDGGLSLGQAWVAACTDL